MADASQTPSEELLRQAGSLISSRKESGNTPLDEAQRAAVQDATVTIVQALRRGVTVPEIEQDLVKMGWQQPVAGHFILLVGRLLSRMYGVRTCLFAGLTVLTAMLASLIVPLAKEGEFSWFLAVVMVLIG